MDRITRTNVAIATIVVTLIASSRTVVAEEASLLAAARESIKVTDVERHANVLASDLLEGREAGSRGGWASGSYLTQQLTKLKLKPAGDDGDFFQPFGNGFRNLLAVIPGSDPQLREEYIIVGAHYDHVGYGAWNNSRGPIGQIHNGADDNASGTATLLEIIEAFQEQEVQPRRSVLFAFWDAEEKGLLGSKHWVANPTVPLEKVRLVLNADMVGRLRSNVIEVYGHRTAPGLRSWLATCNQSYDFTLQFDPAIKADSDHHPFYLKHVPFLMLHTGKHDEYHRPSDDVETLNYKGIEKIARLHFDICYEAAQKDSFPEFREAILNETATELAELYGNPTAHAPARLGMTWDAQLAQKRIVQVTSVTYNSPAALAGLRFGDRILSIGGHETSKYASFLTLVLTAPRTVDVVVQRFGTAQPFLTTLQLSGEPVGLGVGCSVDDAEPNCAIVTQLIPGSPMHMAGLLQGDRIVRVEQKEVADVDEAHALLGKVASPTSIVVERYGRYHTFKVEPIVYEQAKRGSTDSAD